jgi:cell wall-associated NlpC family hydrolase
LLAAVGVFLASGCATMHGPGSEPLPLADVDAVSVSALRDPEPTGPASETAAEDVSARALSLVGAKYRRGGNEPASGLDCSGLVRWVYRDHAANELPRSASAMQRMDAPDIGRDALVAGDLVFFRIGRRVSHVGLYVGDGRFVHAPGKGKPVRVDRMDDPWWRSRYAGAKRPVAASGST